MPTEAGSDALTPQHTARRTLRLALGSSLSLLISQLLALPLSFLMPLLTMVLLMSPMPAPNLKKAIVIFAALLLPTLISMAILMPLFEISKGAALLLLLPAWFGCFYFSAKGGAPVIGLLMSLGLALVIAIGSVNISAMQLVAQSLAISAALGIAMVMVAHALLPDQCSPPATQPADHTAETNLDTIRQRALRPLLIVFPVVIFCLFSSNSMAYLPLMLKTASMGQQASSADTRNMARALLASTLWGGLLALIGWQLLTIWPSLLLYTLFIAIVCCLIGPKIFADHTASAEMWNYALITMLVILAPSLTDSLTSDSASHTFYSRLLLFIAIALYGMAASRLVTSFATVQLIPRFAR